MLAFASLLASRNIPGHILQSVAFPGSGRRAVVLFIYVIIMELLSHSLISTIEMNDRYRCDVHALVQSTVFQRLIRQMGDLHLKLAQLSGILLQNTPQTDLDIAYGLQSGEFVQLIPHIYSVTEKILVTGCWNEVCFDLVTNACCRAVEAQHVGVAYHLCKKQLDMVEALCRGSSNVVNVERHVIV